LAYSNQAVSEISAKSLTISPDTANLADFHLVGALASDWSTLGWIKFRMGDAETAEKYLLAAWRLKQAPSIGERLAEVYEKLGKQTQAAKVCLMALAASDHSAPNEKLSKELEHLRPFLPKLASGSNRLVGGRLGTLRDAYDSHFLTPSVAEFFRLLCSFCDFLYLQFEAGQSCL
jgi:hypothetical protein